jgi:hypothetical protein
VSARRFLGHWYALIERLGLQVFDAELITGSRGQRLYWLVMVARNDMTGDINQTAGTASSYSQIGHGRRRPLQWALPCRVTSFATQLCRSLAS